MHPHVATYKVWMEPDESDTSTNAKYQRYIREEWVKYDLYTLFDADSILRHL